MFLFVFCMYLTGSPCCRPDPELAMNSLLFLCLFFSMLLVCLHTYGKSQKTIPSYTPTTKSRHRQMVTYFKMILTHKDYNIVKGWGLYEAEMKHTLDASAQSVPSS
jgi:hypothetical protein